MSKAATQPAPCGINQRQSPRFGLEVDVTWESDHNFYTGLTQNISSGGLFVATEVGANVGDRMNISFRLPGREAPIEATVEVRWTRFHSSLQRFDGPAGVGVRFLELSAEAEQAIEEFLQQRDSIYFDEDT